MKNPNKKQLDYYAKLVIYDLPTMSNENRRRLANWLFWTYRDIEDRCPSEFDKKYTLRLMK